MAPLKSFLQWRIPVRLHGNRRVVAPSKDTIRDAQESFYDDYYDNSRNSKSAIIMINDSINDDLFTTSGRG